MVDVFRRTIKEQRIVHTSFKEDTCSGQNGQSFTFLMVVKKTHVQEVKSERGKMKTVKYSEMSRD
jgi:hypothetical protein